MSKLDKVTEMIKRIAELEDDVDDLAYAAKVSDDKIDHLEDKIFSRTVIACLSIAVIIVGMLERFVW